MKILMILTSHDQLGNTGQKTGFWLEEFATPYYIFKEANAAVSLGNCLLVVIYFLLYTPKLLVREYGEDHN